MLNHDRNEVGRARKLKRKVRVDWGRRLKTSRLQNGAKSRSKLGRSGPETKNDRDEVESWARKLKKG